ncbi:MAG TPA: IS110 family transposase [Solirubrobacteraceae bacterium]
MLSAGDPGLSTDRRTGKVIVIGIDVHKRSHTAAAVDAATGRPRGEATVEANDFGHQKLLQFAERLDAERLWAIEDRRHLSRRLEAALLRAGERVMRVSPKLMAGARKSARTFGNSDPIDALAVARAALREPNLPVARLAGPERDIALLVDYRANLVVERSRMQCRLRRMLHELDPTLDPLARSLGTANVLARLTRRLKTLEPSITLRLARDLIARIRDLNTDIRQLERDLAPLVRRHAGPLLAVPGIGILKAARILAEVADITCFASDAQLALYAGVAPLPASSGPTQRHRLNRTGNRQLNNALHIIAITRARSYAPAREYIARRRAEGKSGREALRALKRHLARLLFRLLKTTAAQQRSTPVFIAPLAPCQT